MDAMIQERDLADAVRSMGLLADLTINMWSGERTDSTIGARVKADAGAVGNTGRYIKNLMAGCDDKLKEVRSAYASARTTHYKLTLPWIANPQEGTRMQGPRLLPNLLFDRYITELATLRNTATAKLNEFVAEYPDLIKRAMANLAGLAQPSDYPTQEQISTSFKFQFDFTPIPPTSAFPNLPPASLQALSRALQKRQQSSALQAQAAMWERVREHVSHLADRLKDPEATFKEASITNVQELITLLPGYNVTGDDRVSEITMDIDNMLRGITARDIRKDNNLRKAVANDAIAITDKLSTWGV